jgi:formylglycine-generating enzyme
MLRGLAAIAVVLSVAVAHADVFNMGGTRDATTGTWTGLASLEFVAVGDPGNAADTRGPSDGGTKGCGSVGYVYQMGKYDVTVGQYCEFLNAVAKTDTYGVYKSDLADPDFLYYTAGIARSGDPGSYTYSIIYSSDQAANCPIFDVTWGDAARFCNWLQNGQPTGDQGPGTTETGAYTLNGATTTSALMAVARNPDAKYVVPTENEWYKAAYYRRGGTNAGYWTYPTQSDTRPTNLRSPTGTNNANFGLPPSGPCLTPVGFFAASPGTYGTFDMGGDVWQYNEAKYDAGSRSYRGGAWLVSYSSMQAGVSSHGNPAGWSLNVGFRVASVPEPSALALLGIGILSLLTYAWRRRHV